MATKPTDNCSASQAKTRPVSELAESLGKRQPFDLLEEELYVSLLRTTDMMSVQFRELFEQHSLSGPLYNALRIVGGEQKYTPDGVTVGTIAKRMVCRQPDTTRLVDRLEALGYVTRRTSKNDARCRLIKITDQGSSILRELHKPVRELHRQHFRGLTAQQMAQLERLLEAVRSGMTTES